MQVAGRFKRDSKNNRDVKLANLSRSDLTEGVKSLEHFGTCGSTRWPTSFKVWGFEMQTTATFLR